MDEQLLDTATRRLCAAAAADFAALRRTLAEDAAAAGDAETARAIGKVRKPTNAARVVNALVAEDGDIVEPLRDLGERMRAAQDDLDAPRLRELTEERRAAVGDCAKRALALAGEASPPAALRDDVLATFDAAVADPDIAARLGKLQRPERFSGFGFAAGSGPPKLTVVRSAAGAGAKPSSSGAAQTAPKITAAERRKLRRALDDARQRFDAADADLDAAFTGERDAARALAKRERDLSRAKDALEAARAELDATRATLKDTKQQQREARSALNREQRRAPD
jgi:hypothetical protein